GWLAIEGREPQMTNPKPDHELEYQSHRPRSPGSWGWRVSGIERGPDSEVGEADEASTLHYQRPDRSEPEDPPLILSLIVTFSGIGGWLVGALWLYAIISEHFNPTPSYSSPGGTISLPSAGEFALGACMMCPALLGSVIAIPGGL